MYDTIIIGAGMSGLAAGIRLAYFDQRVCILERHYTIGGLNSFYRVNGRDFDVGLHALTNYTPKGTKKGPLARLLRQLRFRWDDFALAPQIGSEVRFPDVALRFTNDLAMLESEVAANFPGQIDNFRRLLGEILEYDDLDESNFALSARKIVGEIITDPLLVEMIFCPLMWYGNAREHDMDWGQFSILFRSIFIEGFARPLAGVRLILKNLVKKFRQLGGELKLRTGVKQINVDGGRATGVVLDNGQELEGRSIVSSAGWPETMRLCEDIDQIDPATVGRLSFTESIAVLDRKPEKIGHNSTIVFYNDSEKFSWEKPQETCDVSTGVICCPNNFRYDPNEASENIPSEGYLRVTTMANQDDWLKFSDEQYALEKLHWYDRIMESAVRFVPDFRRYVIDTDMFTPKTIQRFTWHDNGAVYGSPTKHLDGRTHLDNLYICGTDQGFVGIIGTIISGISIANRYLLRDG